MKSAKPIELLDADEVIERLRLKSRKALRDATHRGQVPRGVRMPGMGLRWRRDEFDAWLAAEYERRRLP